MPVLNARLSVIQSVHPSLNTGTEPVFEPMIFKLSNTMCEVQQIMTNLKRFITKVSHKARYFEIPKCRMFQTYSIYILLRVSGLSSP